MPFKRPDASDLLAFQQILGSDRVLTDEEQLLRCASDQTEDLKYMPDLVLQPVSSEEVSAILKHCYQENIAITPRGAGTGLSGGALPLFGGVSLDMRRMNRILNIDADNFQITTEP